MHVAKAQFVIGKFATWRAEQAMRREQRRGSRHSQTATDTTANEETQAEENQSEENQDNAEKLKEVVEKSQDSLAQARAVFPFDLFPDKITMDRQKITIINRQFFRMEQTVSVQHTDIKNVQADVGPFFGSLTITSEHFINNTQTIRFLTRRDAVEIQRLIQGMIVVHNEGVDISDIDKDDLIKKLNLLGQGDVSKG